MACLFPEKRRYRTMTAADHAAQWCRRREVDAHLVRIIECEGHLHVGHDAPFEPATHHREKKAELTYRLVIPEPVLARLGLPSDGQDTGHGAAVSTGVNSTVPSSKPVPATPSLPMATRPLASR